MLPLGCPQKFDKKIENLFSGRKMESFSVKWLKMEKHLSLYTINEKRGLK